ncbi:MAG: hypothetical protein HQL52_20000 [Magnetococcales bacterium]|nr:hypothetical protein [Magnetococcales bacterium]
MTTDGIEKFLQEKNEALLADLAIHLMLDPEEIREQVEPLIAAGRVERIW